MAARALGVALMLVALSGCGQEFGVLLYHAGLAKQDPVAAEFELPKKPLLILVDDDYDLVQPRTACDALMEALGDELRSRELIDRTTTVEEMAKLRRAIPNFDQRGAREMGELANADIVLWLQVVRFSLADDLDMVISPAYYAVTVKVLDVRVDSRDAVRLWPKTREGRRVEVKVSPHDLRRCKEMRLAQRLMGEKLAVEVAKLFYEYEPEEP